MAVFPFPTNTELTIISRYNGHVDFFGTDADGVVRNVWLDDATTGRNLWSMYVVTDRQTGRAYPGTRVAAVTRNANTMDIFVVGGNGCAWSVWFDDTKGGWQYWFQLGTLNFELLNQPLSAISPNDAQMDVFGIGSDSRVYNAHYIYQWAQDPNQIWLPIGDLEFGLGTPVSAVSRNPQQIDIFVVDSHGYVYSSIRHSNDPAWGEWYRILDGVFPPGANIATRSYNYNNTETIELFGVAGDGAVYTAWWDGAWHGWTPISDGNLFPPGAQLSVEMPFGGGVWGIANDGNIWHSDANWGDPAGGFSRVSSGPQFSTNARLSRYYYYHDQDNADEVQLVIGPDNEIWWSASYDGRFDRMTYIGT